MSFLATLILLAALASTIGLPILVGYGLSEHHLEWILLGAGFGALAAGLFWLHLAMVRRSGSGAPDSR